MIPSGNPGGAKLKRGLSDRHIRFIALGGAIGAGLFLGSGSAIAEAGPAIITAFLLCGAMVFIISRALGELALFEPVAGSFATYAEQYLGRSAGFVTGWTYWLNWVLVGIAELTAVGMFVHFWLPDMPQWVPGLVALAALYLLNSFGVRMFGELEFWLSLLKIGTIIGTIVIGIWMIASGADAGGNPVQLSTLWSHGGWLPTGWPGLLAVLPYAMFAFGGVELIGLTAAEAENPARAIPRAINGVVLRIGIFYIGSMIIVMALTPWNQVAADRSPFVDLFQRIGLREAGGFINLVMLSAVLSSCNSGIFATGRMLFSLVGQGHGPHWIGRLDRRAQPANALRLSSAAMLCGVGLNYLIPKQVFGLVMAADAVFLLFIWAIIVLSHLAYRRRVREGGTAAVTFRLPLSPYSNVVLLLFVVAIAALMGFTPGGRLPFVLASGWIIALFGIARWRVVDRPQR